MPSTLTLLRLVALALAALAPAPVLANDASFLGDGARVFPAHEARVRMAREKVAITWTGAPPYTWQADCTFEFENLADRPVQVQMGFPDSAAHSEAVRGPWAIRAFTATVDGRPVATEHKELTPAHARKAGYQAAYLWPVTLAPRARVTVRNTYAFGGTDTNGPFATVAGRGSPLRREHVFWRVARSPSRQARSQADFEDGAPSTISYVVTTGRTWAGPIGESEISIQLPPGIPVHQVIPLPTGYQVEGGRVVWRFRNWRPRHEIHLYWLRWVPPPEDARDDAQAGHFGPQTVAQARAWVRFARRSRYDRASLQPVKALVKDPAILRVLLAYEKDLR